MHHDESLGFYGANFELVPGEAVEKPVQRMQPVKLVIAKG